MRIGLGDGYVTGPWISDVQNAAIDGTIIDLRAYNIFLAAGQVFVADLINATDSVFGSASALGGPLLFSNANWGLEALAWDGALAYTTYFDDGNAAAMPLPPSWTLMGLGLAALLVIRGLKSRSADANSCDCRAFDDAKMSS